MGTRGLGRERGGERGGRGGTQSLRKGEKTDFPHSWTKYLSARPREEDNGKVLSKDLICWR